MLGTGVKCESESSLNFIISANHSSQCYCSPPRHRIELRFLACVVGLGQMISSFWRGRNRVKVKCQGLSQACSWASRVRLRVDWPFTSSSMLINLQILKKVTMEKKLIKYQNVPHDQGFGKDSHEPKRDSTKLRTRDLRWENSPEVEEWI